MLTDFNLLENLTILIDYKFFIIDLILVIIVSYNYQKIIIIIRYNRLLTPNFGCGQDIESS